MVEVERRSGLPILRAPAHFLIVEAPYYLEIGAMLRDGAAAAFAGAGASFDVVTVPGSLEIAPAMAIALKRGGARGKPYAGAIGLGCIVRGETYHFEIVANESARGITLIGIDRALPVGNGVLTVETLDQAFKRADPAQGDKGGEAARAAMTLYMLAQAGGERG